MRILLILPLLLLELNAQNAPYDKPPKARPPYYRVRYDASEKPGELIFAVQYTVWIPEGVKTLRGVIVHQHGCGEGSCRSGQTGAFDLHWQALAQKHNCALLSPSYEQPQKANCQMWCDPRNGSSQAFHKSLIDLGKLSGHPELTTVPWALWGHSGGGHWAGGMVMLHPKRVVGAWLRSGVPSFTLNPERPTVLPHQLPEAALNVPMMCNPGTKEGVTVKEGRFARVWPMNKTFIIEIRKRGGLLGLAVDPLSAHECGNQRYMAIPWLDACLSARLPDKAGKALKPMPKKNAWLAPILGKEAVPADESDLNSVETIWLPNATIARKWMHYVRDTKIPDSTPPPAPTRIKISGGKLTWETEADIESGLSHFIILCKGKEVGRIPEKSTNKFGRPIFQGLLYSDTPVAPLIKMEFRLKDLNTTSKDYEVVAVNTVGLKSK